MNESQRKAPNCAKCRNHFLNNGLKGHKRYCKFRFCMCQKCCLTVQRQKIMAKQTAVRRAQAQDEQRSIEGHSNNNELPVSLSHPPSLVASVHLDDSCSSTVATASAAGVGVDVNALAAALPVPPAAPEVSSSPANGLQLRQSIKLIIDKHNLTNNSVPVIYAMLKSFQFDVSRVLEQISNAQIEISEYIQKMMQTEPPVVQIGSPDSTFVGYSETPRTHSSWPLQTQRIVDSTFDPMRIPITNQSFLLGTNGSPKVDSTPVLPLGPSANILPLLPGSNPQSPERAALFHSPFGLTTTSPEPSSSCSKGAYVSSERLSLWRPFLCPTPASTCGYPSPSGSNGSPDDDEISSSEGEYEDS